jgi:hypothetical protein
MTRKVHIVTMTRLNRALAKVNGELERHGVWDERLQKTAVYLVWFGRAFGWQHYGGSGEICIPAVSFNKLNDFFQGSYTALADVLRHEYGHALADTHRGLFRSRQFSSVFGGSHDNDRILFSYDPESHVTEYASINASEDFAEVFMLYLRHRGNLPTRFQKPALEAKWGFVTNVCGAIAAGRRRW